MNAWYTELIRPPLTPPSWVFGPVWTVLYFLIAASIILYVIETRNTRPYWIYALILAHLIANLAWSPVFFGLRRIGWALFDIVIIDLTLIAMIYLFYQAQKAASILLWPYLAWVLFATYLNSGFYLLNR